MSQLNNAGRHYLYFRSPSIFLPSPSDMRVDVSAISVTPMHIQSIVQCDTARPGPSRSSCYPHPSSAPHHHAFSNLAKHRRKNARNWGKLSAGAMPPSTPTWPIARINLGLSHVRERELAPGRRRLRSAVDMSRARSRLMPLHASPAQPPPGYAKVTKGSMDLILHDISFEK